MRPPWSRRSTKVDNYTTRNHWILLWILVARRLFTWLIVKSGLLDRIETGSASGDARCAPLW